LLTSHTQWWAVTLRLWAFCFKFVWPSVWMLMHISCLGITCTRPRELDLLTNNHELRGMANFHVNYKLYAVFLLLNETQCTTAMDRPINHDRDVVQCTMQAVKHVAYWLHVACEHIMWSSKWLSWTSKFTCGTFWCRLSFITYRTQSYIVKILVFLLTSILWWSHSSNNCSLTCCIKQLMHFSFVKKYAAHWLRMFSNAAHICIWIWDHWHNTTTCWQYWSHKCSERTKPDTTKTTRITKNCQLSVDCGT